MPIIEKGDVKLSYEEAGHGFPLLVLPGGGLNAAISSLRASKDGSPKVPFNPLEEFADICHVIALDMRNSNYGSSEGPLEVDRPWDSYADDQLALMDHFGYDKFMVIGFCVGGPLIWNLLKRAQDRVVAAVLSQPSGFNPEAPTIYYDNNMRNWGPPLCERRDDIDMDQVEAFLRNMYLDRGDFLLTVDRDFVRNCHVPLLVMPDDVPAHPYATAMESAELAPNAQVTIFPWKKPESRVPIAVRHAHSFLKSYLPE